MGNVTHPRRSLLKVFSWNKGVEGALKPLVGIEPTVVPIRRRRDRRAAGGDPLTHSVPAVRVAGSMLRVAAGRVAGWTTGWVATMTALSVVTHPTGVDWPTGGSSV